MKASKTENQFSQGTDIGFIGRGSSVEECFAQIARAMFSFMTDVNHSHALQIVSFEFEEEDLQQALSLWLNLLLTKSNEQHMMFGDFRLKREGPWWKATVSGEPWRAGLDYHSAIKNIKQVSQSALSIKKVGQTWEARCVIAVYSI